MKNNISRVKLERWILNNCSNFGNLIRIKKFKTGQSNPTYKVDFDNKIIVLRSQPKGKLLKGAHRIDREYKVMGTLYKSEIPVPNVIKYCDDKSIIGREFFLMEYIDGIQH